jgi:hypothetical protein
MHGLIRTRAIRWEPIPYQITKHALDTGMVTIHTGRLRTVRGADGSDFASDRSPNRVSRLYSSDVYFHHKKTC